MGCRTVSRLSWNGTLAIEQQDFMSLLFETFCGMMDKLPAAVVKKAASVERRILEVDIATGREEAVGDVASVLTFCRFLESGAGHEPAVIPDLPSDHLTFYAKIVHKLAEAGELSQAAQSWFNNQLAGMPVKTRN